MLKHVAAFPSEDILIYSVMTNDIKKFPSRRDMQIFKDMLGKIKHDAQGKTTMKSSEPIDASNQLVELTHTIKT